MKRFTSGLCATALAASFAIASIFPVNAASIYVPQGKTMSSDVQLIASRGHRSHGGHGGYNRIYRRNGHHYYHGHRGYDHYRHGYRRYGNYWFPLAAFATGAIVGGAIANDNPPVYGSSHEARCYARYRSYRAYDNTYQPYNGPRRQCLE